MLYRKKGLPEEGDLVLCTVSKVLANSVFVTLDEYGIDGLIHISEVSPGRIRNIRDFVREGKKVVCKVLRVYTEKMQIDVSLRRVNDNMHRNKIAELKSEEKAEKILEYVAKQLGKDPVKFYEEITPSIFKKYDGLHNFFMDMVNDEAKAQEFIPDKKISEELESIIKQRLKPAEVYIKGSLILISYANDGVEVVRTAVKKAIATKGIDIKYLGAGKYDMVVTALDYPAAEAAMEKASNAALDFMKGKPGVAEFTRQK
jgi:translation initiation factor 2 subunit 1